MPKRIMVQCATQINKDAIKRTSVDGIEHIIVSSYTLPDDVVMNGGLYPADEIAKGFPSLERTLAPVEHPVDSQGNFLSATDPDAIHSFHAGAFNKNVSRSNGRVHIEKHINVQEALKSERGKRLLDRVNEVETNDNPRPLHTSVGLFLEVEDLDAPQTNAAGKEFTWIARNMMFDHDAILLDSVGAATPGDGVGMAVNASGDKMEVHCVKLETGDGGGYNGPERKATDHRTNAEGTEGTSFAQIEEQLNHKINGIVNADWIWLVDVFNDAAIFETNQGFFTIQWSMSNGVVEVFGLPLRVTKEVKYIPKVNSKESDMVINGALADRLNRLIDQKSKDEEEKSALIDSLASAAGIQRGTLLQILSGDIDTPPDERLRGFARVLGVSFDSLKTLVDNAAEEQMKNRVINALKEAGVKTEGLTDDQIFDAHAEMLTNAATEAAKATPPADGVDTDAVTNAVTEAMKPMMTEIEGLKTKINANDEAELNKLAELVGNSDKHPGIDVEAAKAIPLDTLKAMAAGCADSVGIGFTQFNNDAGDEFIAPGDMPE